MMKSSRVNVAGILGDARSDAEDSPSVVQIPSSDVCLQQVE